MKKYLSARLEVVQSATVRQSAAVALLVAAGASHAAGDVDVSAAVSTIGTGAAAIAALGAAYLALTVLKKLWRKLGG